MLRGLFHTKNLGSLLASAEDPNRSLRRSLGVLQLTMLGIGAIIGAGIFSTVGTAVAGGADHLGAGPAVVLSFVLTAVACCFSALCYAEWASMVPLSGSAYTYAYATLGECVAWIIGWDLILEYAIGNTAIAISWSGYFQQLLAGMGIELPSWLGTDYRTAGQAVVAVEAARAAGQEVLGSLARNAQALAEAPKIYGLPVIFNLPAFGIVAIITWILYRGAELSARFNTTMVVVKLAIVAFFIVLGAFYIDPKLWNDFAPNGFHGVASAAAILFFAYIGFDAISTASEEAKNPQRDMPKAILGSLLVCTLVYIAVGIILTGLLPWNQLGTAEPLATAFEGLGMNWAAGVISVGALFATTSVLIVFQLGQPRIFFSMARDGLFPQWAAAVHPRFGTPHVTTLISGVFVAVLSGFANLDEIVQLTNIGTLFAFILVCIGITVLRVRDPGRERSFRVPGGPYLIPILGVVSCVTLIVYLPPTSWWRFIGWLVLGMAVYFWYGYQRSVVGRESGRSARADALVTLIGLGFFVLTVGLFVLPHDQGPTMLVRMASDGALEGHARALWGLGVSVVGLVIAAVALGWKARQV